MTTNHGVAGSNPAWCTRKFKGLAEIGQPLFYGLFAVLKCSFVEGRVFPCLQENVPPGARKQARSAIFAIGVDLANKKARQQSLPGSQFSIL
jgi:hypothetical protein